MVNGVWHATGTGKRETPYVLEMNFTCVSRCLIIFMTRRGTPGAPVDVLAF